MPLDNLSKTSISTTDAPAAIGPYSQAVRVGDTLYTSGQIPIDPATGNLVPGGIAEQTTRVLDNLKAVLTACLPEHAPELFYNAGLICQKRGQTEDAVAFYQQALNEAPQFAEALLNLGHAMMSLGQEDDARSFWRRAIREKPELAQTYFAPPLAS